MYLIIRGKFEATKDVVQLQYGNVYPEGQADPDNLRSGKPAFG